MQRLWSAERRAGLWRRLWLALAEAERELGIAIPDDALTQMRAHLDDVDLEAVRGYERELRHDVMAHVHHFGDQAPAARAYLHLGATSAFVTDNAELLVLRDALRLVAGRCIATIGALGEFARAHRELPTLAYTHYQPAQLTTVGKRATLWLHDFLVDAQALHRLLAELPFRGCKGTTGTQASYLELFGGDHDRVRKLDERVAAAFGFDRLLPVTGQTYTRKIDSAVLDALSGVAQSASKFGTDLRLLQHEGEVLEPIERKQIGSSAMAYKRNPMRAERICALARYVIAQQQNAHYTAATQWLERTLDDSANRRLALPEAFLATDATLVLAANVAGGLEVRPHVVRQHVDREMPFMATERWLMLGVQAGGDRQALHEVIRQTSRDVAEAVADGGPNDLVERLASHEAFTALDADQLRQEMDPHRYVGRAPEQVVEFLDGPVAQALERLADIPTPDDAAITV
jgi:adenylosuccinate lyase